MRRIGILTLAVCLVFFFMGVADAGHPGRGGGHHGGHGGGHDKHGCPGDTPSEPSAPSAPSAPSVEPTTLDNGETVGLNVDTGCDTSWQRATYPECFGLPYELLLQNKRTGGVAVPVIRYGFNIKNPMTDHPGE